MNHKIYTIGNHTFNHAEWEQLNWILHDALIAIMRVYKGPNEP